MSLTGRVFSERRRVVLPLIVFLVANIAGLGGVFWLQQSIDSAKVSRDQAQQTLLLARKNEKNAKDQKVAKDLADVQLHTFYGDVLPHNLASAINVLNFWLGKTAQKSKVSYRAGQYQHDQVRDSRLTKVSGDITLVGDYADVRRFLYELETSQEFIVIEKVGLEQPNSTTGNAQLEVALSVATYFLTDGQPATVAK